MANVFWRMRECREVLPLAVSPVYLGTSASTLNLANLQCSTTVLQHYVGLSKAAAQVLMGAIAFNVRRWAAITP